MNFGELLVAGVDVGGKSKGFPAVVLRGSEVVGVFRSSDPLAVADWCRGLGAQVVGVDAPCGWSKDGHSRPAERELMGHKIWCFSTPKRETAVCHPRNYYGWMLAGEELYRQLSKSHPLLPGLPVEAGAKCCRKSKALCHGSA